MTLLTAANLRSLFFVSSVVLLLPYAMLLLISGWSIGIPVLGFLFFGWLIAARTVGTQTKFALTLVLSPVLMIAPYAINPIAPFTNIPDPLLAVRSLAGIDMSLPQTVWPDFWWTPQLPLILLYGSVILILSGFSVGQNFPRRPRTVSSD